MIEKTNKALLVKRRWVVGVMALCFCSLPSCGNLPSLLDPILGETEQVLVLELANGERWAPPVGCTTPWGIAESAQSESNIKRIDEFPSDADWVNVSGNGELNNPLVIVGIGEVVTKMVRIREGSSYVILDGLTIRPEPSRDYGWNGSDVLIEGGTHHIAVRNCVLRSTSNANANLPQAPTTSDPNVAQLLVTNAPNVTQAPVTNAPNAAQSTKQRTLLTTQPTKGRNVEYLTVFNCTAGPLGDWTQNDGTDHGGFSFPAGTKHVRVFDCTISDIGGDGIGFPDESMFTARGGAEFPTTDIQIGRCHLQRCKENLIDGKLVQDIIISECTLEKTNAFSTSSRGDAIVFHIGSDASLQQIINDHGGTLQWLSPDNAWLLFNDIRDLSRGAIFTAATFTPDDRKGTMYSVGNRWTNIRAAGRGSGTGLLAGNGNLVLSFSDTFSNVDEETYKVVIEDQSPQEAFRRKFGRDLGRLP